MCEFAHCVHAGEDWRRADDKQLAASLICVRSANARRINVFTCMYYVFIHTDRGSRWTKLYMRANLIVDVANYAYAHISVCACERMRNVMNVHVHVSIYVSTCVQFSACAFTGVRVGLFGRVCSHTVARPMLCKVFRAVSNRKS